MDQPSYVDYYERVITQNTNGLKHVLGGTGLGKTSAIAEVVTHSVTDKQYIYIANRVQLLNEMAERLQGLGIQYVHLQKDSDTVFTVLRSPHKQALYQLLQSDTVERYADSINQKSPQYRLTPQRVISMCEEIEQHLAPQAIRPDLLSELLDQRAVTVLSFIKRIVLEASKYEGQGKRGTEYAYLLEHPVVQQFFPYIAFSRNRSLRVLLITLQKAFYGFFDGLDQVSLTTLTGSNGNRIVFLDEFDFLEHDLIRLICKDAQISNPLQFVSHFYRAMKHHKLPLPDYPQDDWIRQRVEGIIAAVDGLQRVGLNFPTINQFTCTLRDLKDFAIFETKHSVLTQDLFLHATSRSFEIVTSVQEKSDKIVPVSEAFRIIRFAVGDILGLSAQLAIASPTLYRELARQCFDNTVFKDQIEQMRQFPRAYYTQNTRFDALLEEGFGFSEIYQLGQVSDPSEVEFNHFAIYTTPEKMLATVAESNLVFGLSATAIISRYVRNFNTYWLANQGRFPYYPVDAHDVTTIQLLNRAKQERRSNALHVVQASELDILDPVQKQLVRFIEAVAGDEGFGGDDPKGYRRL